MRTQREGGHLQARKRALARNQRAGTLILASPASGTVSNKRLLSEPPHLWDLSQRPMWDLTHHGQCRCHLRVAVWPSSHTVAFLVAFIGGRDQRCTQAGDNFHRGQKGNQGGSLVQGRAGGRPGTWAVGTCELAT